MSSMAVAAESRLERLEALELEVRRLSSVSFALDSNRDVEDELEDEIHDDDEEQASCLKRMAKEYWRRFKLWLLEIEMGVVWGVAGVSIIIFVFAAIWFIDPALLTLVLQFRQAVCTTTDSAFLVGISNCSWTSCRHGCTREIYKCWQVQVEFEFVEGSEPHQPLWASLSDFKDTEVNDGSDSKVARLYPNVRGCGYPPDLDCQVFYDKHKTRGESFDCWVSTMDNGIAMTELDLERAKREVLLSLLPLFTFIIFVLYAFCRLGIFTVCNPLKVCPKAVDAQINVPSLTPMKLYDYKRSLVTTMSNPKTNGDFIEKPIEELHVPMTSRRSSRVAIPTTIEEEEQQQPATTTTTVTTATTTTSAAARRRIEIDDDYENLDKIESIRKLSEASMTSFGISQRVVEPSGASKHELDDIDVMLDELDNVSIRSVRRFRPDQSAASSSKSVWREKRSGKIKRS